MQDFQKIVVDMTQDILLTFPEQATRLHPALQTLLQNQAAQSQVPGPDAVPDAVPDAEAVAAAIAAVHTHCLLVYPPQFLDIMHQNPEVFSKGAEACEFLPGIAFNGLWQEELSNKTRETIWKYLQLVLFTIVSSTRDHASFGDTAKLLEAVNADEFKSKLEETMRQMQALFATKETATPAGDLPVPNAASIHEHLAGMLDGNLGKLAREIAQETAADLLGSATSVNDVFQNLLKNPTKLMGLVNSVSSRLDSKLKSGDIKESDLMKEAGDLMKKMKETPGLSSIQSLLGQFGLADILGQGQGQGQGKGQGQGQGQGQGKGQGKGQGQGQGQGLVKASKQRDRMLQKLAKKSFAAAVPAPALVPALVPVPALAPVPATPAPVKKTFSKGSQMERSSMKDKPAFFPTESK